MRSLRLLVPVLTITTLAAISGISASAATGSPDRHGPGRPSAEPIVLGHRGAAGYRPEHTRSGYELAAQLGADYIEPDLVPTRDGVLVDRHEPDISATTDVGEHAEFAARKTTKIIDGVSTTGWFTTDFTLAELKTLRAVERLPDVRQHNTLYNGRDQILTLQEVLDLRTALSARYHRTIGIVPEIKHSTFFRSLGLPMEDRTLAVLAHNGLNRRDSAVIIQSFEVGNLRYLHQHTPVPLLQLTSASGAPADLVAAGDPRTYADLTSTLGLRTVAGYATYLGPDKNEIVPRDATGALSAPTSLITDAHRVGLKVTPYTFRNENSFQPRNFQRGVDPSAYGDAFAEFALFFSLGVDGVFTDNTDTAVAARAEWLAAGRPVRAAA